MKGLSSIVVIIMYICLSDPLVADAQQHAGIKTFVYQAMRGGFKEIDASEMATHVAITGDIKSFAREMVSDHGKVNQELKRIVESKHYPISLPSAADVSREPLLAG